MVEPVLSVADLSIGLPQGADRKLGVDGATLEVFPNQITCIVGESGSGKSLTASAIMDLLPRGVAIRGGTIRLDGKELTSLGAREMRALCGDRVAMVFQEPMTALNPAMRIGAQIAEVFALHRPEMGAAEIGGRILDLLKSVGLPRPEQMRRAFPHQLSGGQRQRVVIAMALALEPTLVIADEPTTALDVTTQAQILRLFRDLLARRSGGILLITHDFGVVAEVADRVVVMQAGKVVEQGAAVEVLETPRHPYTRTLIDAVPGWRFRPAAKVEAPVISVRNLTLDYHTVNFMGRRSTVRALDGVSFDLRRGETLGIVGESGSGKTTLARTLMGFERPGSGRIEMAGADVTSLTGAALRGHRRRVQMIFQDPYRSMNPRQKVLDLLTEGPVQLGTPRAKAKVQARALMQAVGLGPDVFDRFPHEFSGGQRQRICIARALAMEPEVIVADEAVSALDVSVQSQVLALFEKLQMDFGFSMIFVTHDLRVAANICDRIAVMQDGRIVEMGPAEQIMRHGEAAYTRRLLASIPGGTE